MPKNKKLKTNIQPLEILALLAAIGYIHSFNTILHHISFGFRSEHPDPYTLLFALVVTIYYASKRRTLSTISVVTLTILAVVSASWFFGYCLNYY